MKEKCLAHMKCFFQILQKPNCQRSYKFVCRLVHMLTTFFFAKPSLNQIWRNGFLDLPKIRPGCNSNNRFDGLNIIKFMM